MQKRVLGKKNGRCGRGLGYGKTDEEVLPAFQTAGSFYDMVRLIKKGCLFLTIGYWKRRLEEI